MTALAPSLLIAASSAAPAMRPDKETAMAATPPPASIHRQGDKTWIDHVPAPQGLNSVLAALTSLLTAAGEDVDYPYLMGVSSRAFRLQFSWCPSAPHAHCGFNTFHPALRATGYESRVYPLSVWQPETRKQREATNEELAAAQQAVRDSIDAGIPALMNSEECGVLAGYAPIDEDNPTGWLRLPGPFGPPPDYAGAYVHPVTHMPWDVCVVAKSAQPPPDRCDPIIWSLYTAVRNAHKPCYGGYSMGFAAYERWIAELDDLRPIIAHTQELLDQYNTDESAPAGLHLANAWCYDSLIDARKVAAVYLRLIAGDAPDTARPHLEAAAASYDKLVAELNRGVDSTTLIAPYPGMETPWTNDLRTNQAQRLRRALELERQAIGRIEAALGAMSITMMGPSKSSPRRRDGGRVMIEAVDRLPCPLSDSAPAAMNHPAGLVLCARQMGVEVEPDWLYGATGFAFALNVNEGLCPSGPTAWKHEVTDALAANAGLRVTRFAATRDECTDDEFTAKQVEMFEHVKQSIDAGRIVIGWEMMHPDWYPVVGYDDEGNFLYSHPDHTIDQVHHTKIGRMDIPGAFAIFAEPCEPAADRTTVRQALAFALDHAEHKHEHARGVWHASLSGYDAWIALLSQDEAKTEGLGQHYNAMCWAECRHHAPLFLAESNERLNVPSLAGAFDRAMAQYRIVAEMLTELYRLSPMDWNRFHEANERFNDPLRRKQWVALLEAARAAEAEGLQSLRELHDGL